VVVRYPPGGVGEPGTPPLEVANMGRPTDDGPALGAGANQRVIVFDVIETLLDLEALAPQFERVFGDAAALREWFGQMLQSALAITVAQSYTDFGGVAKAALQMTAERRGVNLSGEETGRLLGGIRSLPPHPDSVAGLKRLRDAGFRLAALTNSAPKVLEAQVSAAGLAEYFDRLLSVDAVKQFKPAPSAYHSAAARLGVAVDQVRLVAAHSWDVGGALRAGCAAAFVARPGMVLDPLFDRPDIVGRDVPEVARAIIAVDVPLRGIS
jgi:2-haloacid dehalogenase